MEKKFSFFRNNKIYYYVYTAYTLFFILVINAILNLGFYEDNIKKTLLNNFIAIIDDTSSNILDEMLLKNKDFVRSNLTDKKLRLQNEKTLSFLKNQDVKSIYILFIKQEKYFFLLDVDSSEKTNLGEPFIPEKLDLFDRVANQKEKNIFIQKEIDNLAFTLVKPVVENKKTIGFLVIDYSENRLASLLNSSVNFLTYLLLLIMALLFLFICYVTYTQYIKYKMYHNPYTDTLNKIYMTDNYDDIAYKKYYIALIDIDFFKRVNSLYGQANGDKVILSVLKILASYLQKNDMLIQYSGEEFLIFLSKKNRTEEDARYFLEDIRVGMERAKFSIARERFSLTISMGVLLETEMEKSLQDVIHKADTALYKAKHTGRNVVCFYDISHTKRLYREKLKEMIESDKLVCYYQEIRDLESKELHHYEALLRIEDDNKIIFPDRILPDLEGSHLYSYLTKRVVDYNIEKLRLDSKIRISINLSADDLINDSILSILAENADLSDRLYIEILETKSIDYTKVELSLQKLKLFGYKICIDDFGSGYSNLNHLLNLSIDYLKIDGSIIKEIYHDKKAYSLVKTFAVFCEQNNIEVIAEYIDNQDVVDILKGFGVKYGQGWYFSKALPYEELDLEHK